MNSEQIPQSVKDLHQSSNVNHMMDRKMRTQQNKIKQKKQRNNILVSLVIVSAVIIALIAIIISLLKQNAEYKRQNSNYENLMKKIASSDANVNKSKLIEQFLSQKPIVYSNNGEIQQLINLEISQCQQKLSLFMNQSQKQLEQQKKQIQEKTNKKIAEIQLASKKVLFSAKQIINQYKSEYQEKHKTLQTERGQKEGDGVCKTLIQTIGKDHARKFNQIVWGRQQIKEQIPENQSKLYFPTYDELVNMTAKNDLIIVTVARQESFLQHLYKYMKKYSSQFNSWHLWITSSTLPHTIQYIQNLKDQNDWIKIIRLDQSQEGQHELKYLHQTDNQTNKIYLKIDQKIIWIQKNFVQIIFKYRFRLTNHLFVIPNIVNNGIINHIQQNFGPVRHKTMFDYTSLGNSMWDDTLVSYIHNKLINLIETNRTEEWKAFKEWQLLFWEKINMTVSLYYSNTYSSLEFLEERDYDTLYSQIYPRRYGVPGTIISEPIFSYQANQYQTEFVKLQFPLIFKKYKQFADSL